MGAIIVSIISISIMCSLSITMGSELLRTMHEDPQLINRIADNPGLIVLLLLLFAPLFISASKKLDAIKKNVANAIDKALPTPSTTTSATAKKSATAVGKCQDCGCELLDADATFCEDCQLAVFMANDEAVSLDQLGVAE